SPGFLQNTGYAPAVGCPPLNGLGCSCAAGDADSVTHFRCASPLQPRRVGARTRAAGDRNPAQGGAKARAHLERGRRRPAAPAPGGARSRHSRAAAVPHARRRRHLVPRRERYPLSRRPAAEIQVRRHRGVSLVRRGRGSSGAAKDGRACARARTLPARALGRRRGRAVVPAVAAGAHPLGARRLRPPRARRRDAEEAQEPLGRPRVPHRPRLERQGRSRLARGVPPVSRPLHGRHRQLYARALALHPGPRRLVAALACRPAARRGRAHRMEKRRTGFCFLAAAVLSFPAWPCTVPGDATRLESSRYFLGFKAEAVEVARHFSVDVTTCPKPGQPQPEALKVDAQMPEHRHGMNYAPAVKALGPGHWRADGLMFHMPGKWELAFEVTAGGATDRLVATYQVGAIDFSKDEIAKILRHGPWPPPLAPDPSNRVSGKPEAVALGEKLFFEPRRSGTDSVLCATCHVPYRGWQDGRARAFGLELVDRNTPTVVDARFHRWFGWDGARDSLWAQSIRPLLDPREMRATPSHIAGTIRALFPKDYVQAFGRPVPQDDEEVLVDVGKALAAFQETLVSGRTPFDDFRDALERGETKTSYSLAAQRGLRIFIGKGNCSVCHFGPQFTNGEFADT